MQFLNVSNSKNFSYFFFDAANQSAGAATLRMYFCNSSYSTGDPSVSGFCTNFYNQLSTVAFNASDGSSNYYIAPLTINITTGMVGSVVVTNTSYLLMEGRPGGNAWNAYYITNQSRTGALQTTTNSGTTWTNLAGTQDVHLHQFSGMETFWYYACASDTAGSQNCTSGANVIRQDLVQTGGLSPNPVTFISPTNKSYKGSIQINYSPAVSPNSYAISSYNITLENFTDSFVSEIQANNSPNLSYIFDSRGVADGSYNIHINACDTNGLCSLGESADFYIDNTAPVADFSCAPNQVYLNDVIRCTCSASDALSGINSSSYIPNPPTNQAGSFSTICTATDNAGNSANFIFNYGVSAGGTETPGGGSPSGGAPSAPLITPPKSAETGKNQTVHENETINVVVASQKYELNVTDVGNDSVTYVLSSDNITRQISVGSTQNLSVNGYVVSVKLEGIQNGQAVLNVLLSKETLQAQIMKFVEQNKATIIPIAVSVAIIAGAIAVLFIMRNILREIKYRHSLKKAKREVRKHYIPEHLKKDIYKKIQEAHLLRQRANELMKEAQAKKRAEAMKRIAEANNLKKKSEELARQAHNICRNCKLSYKKK